MALKDIKSKIQATKRMHTVTRAMEAVSAAKMRKTQGRALAGRAYARAALTVLSRLAGTKYVAEHILGKARTGNKLGLIVITSDRGLAGSLNTAVLKAAVSTIGTRTTDEVTIYAYGKKGQEFFARRGYTIAQFHENKEDAISPDTLTMLTKTVTDAFAAGSYDAVWTTYSNFKSTFEQAPTARQLLPLSLPVITAIVQDILPVKGKWADTGTIASPATYTVEPSTEAVLDVLIPKLTGVALYHMMLEAKASEHSARMVAMKNASDKSRDVTKTLTRVFNKIRQAAITREVSEIVSGREALAS